MRVVRVFASVGLVASLLVALSCGDDAPPVASTGPAGATATPDDAGVAAPRDGSGDAGPLREPLYLVNTSVFNPDSTVTFVAALRSLGAEAKLDTATALEAPGMAKLYAREGLGWFALGGGEEPTLTRYTIDASGQLAPTGQSLTLQPRGTTYMGDTVVFVSSTQAYYFDAPNHQLVRWNPEAMTVDGEIELPMTQRSGLTTAYDIKPLLRDDGKLLFPVSWRNFETDAVHPAVGLVVIDTRSDTVVRYAESDRCQGVTWSTRHPSGDLYLATAPFYAVLQRANGIGPAACVLRVKAGSDDFDPDYRVDLASLVGGRAAGGLATGPDGTFFFRAVEPGVAVGPGTDATEVWQDAVWRWVHWDPRSNETRVVEALPPSAAGGLTYDVDGKVLATDSAADFSRTTLIDLTAAGGPRPALSAPGYIYGVARVR